MPGSALRRTPSLLDVPGVPGPRALFAQCALRCGRRAIGRHAFGRQGAFAATPHSGLRGAAPTRARRRTPALRNSYARLRRGAPCCAWAHGLAPRVVGAPADGQLGPDTAPALRIGHIASQQEGTRAKGAPGGARGVTRNRGQALGAGGRGQRLAEEREGKGGNARGRVDSTVGSHNWQRAPCRMRRQGTERSAGGANLRPVRAMKTAALSAHEASSGLRSLTHLEAGTRKGARLQQRRAWEHQRGAVAGALHGRARRHGTHRGSGRGNRDTRRELGTSHRQLHPKVGGHGTSERPHRPHIDHGRLWNREGVHHHE
ncbi:hypothetical protein ERJ75_000639000 [Trypanosoma vivax]|nr:hypothetical protein ERJ75_000639000 [Trypanosoma vivax]